MQKSRFSRTRIALLTAACLAWGGAAQAQQPVNTVSPLEWASATLVADATPARKQAKRTAHHHRQRMHGKHKKHFRGHRRAPIVMVVPGYGGVGQHVVDQLSLTHDQQALLAQAQDTARQARLTWSRKPQQTIGTMDPRGRLQEREEQKKERLQAREQSTEHWLQLWDSLDDQQQAMLSGVFAERSHRSMQRRNPS